MISLILPYWNRQEAADTALKLLDQTYKGCDVELVIVDDGGGFVMPDLALKTVLVTLPKKDVPKCPCTAWNAGVVASNGELIALSCIEILHEKPVLEQMAETIKAPQDYVLAAAWCPEFGEWHCHSSVSVPTCPPGSGIAFLGMMRRELFNRAGGFDEAYREGAGYEDRDFIQRIWKVGANFIHRDDLMVIHPKSGATTTWPEGGFARNEALYLSKWPAAPKQDFYNICCINWRNYCGRGAEYVNNLFDAVRRHVRRDVHYSFICFTDDATGLHEEISVRPMPANLVGWDNKIALFKPGLFEDGERVIFFDLDTLILGDLDALLAYKGSLGTLRDFWRPEGLGPAVIAWEAGKHTDIWTRYAGEQLTRGDQEWLERYWKPDLLQDLMPGFFASYKTHCNPYPPKEASVICFHGHPRPHECTQKWVQESWKVGGSSTLNVTVSPNTDTRKILANVLANKDRANWLVSSPAHEGGAVLVGSGPSLLENIERIRAHQSAGYKVFALNNSAKVLHDRGIKPDFQVMLDARESNVTFVKEQYPDTYLIASQCSPLIFDAVEGRQVIQWHPFVEGLADMFPDNPITLIGGGTTIGLSAMALCFAMGYRNLALFGYDSSFRESQTHAIPQDRTPGEMAAFDVFVGDKSFKANAVMAKQAELFPGFAQTLADLDVVIRVYGDGLLPYIASLIADPSTT